METSGHMHIGEVAARTELSLRTIRHYDEVGLVRPSARSLGGFRLYTEADVARLMVIRRMKPLGFTLEEMGELLSITDRLDETTPPTPQPATEPATEPAERPAPASEPAERPALSPAERAHLAVRLARFEEAARDRCAALRTQLARAEEFATDLRHRAEQLSTDPT
ncbi:MerR family transcriptional regulator [Nonomuraea sp. NPDC049421]|uniref:MerR family transcriptional regulator n=1 Tax=Nonomuraea sp. NPDC049421 TaxID=3155275 RepID=UPI0034308BD0